MDKPNYVLKTNESVLIPASTTAWQRVFRALIWSIVATLIVGSLIFKENMFSKLPWGTQILIAIMTIEVFFAGRKKIGVPSEMEIQFYDDYLVLYSPKRYYNKRVTRKDISTMKYNDISKCVYYAKSLRVQIYGDGTSVWYNYKKNGELPDSPTETRSFTEGMIYFSTICAPDVDFVKEIEEHSTIKVTVENS